MALSACGSTAVQYKVPKLNEQDQKRFDCVEYPDLKTALESLPEQKFLTGSDGTKVLTDGQYTWIRHDIASEREGILIRYGAVDGKLAHFVCKDNLKWLSGTWQDLEQK